MQDQIQAAAEPQEAQAAIKSQERPQAVAGPQEAKVGGVAK